MIKEEIMINLLLSLYFVVVASCIVLTIYLVNCKNAKINNVVYWFGVITPVLNILILKQVIDISVSRNLDMYTEPKA